MSTLTAEQFAQRAFGVNVLDERQLDAVWADLRTRDVPLEQFKQLLIRRELLTNWQVEKILRNDRTGYFYGAYKVLYLVGAGTFARVFRAVDTKEGRVIALKVLRRRWCEDPEKTEQFLHEGRMGMKLRHPSIVPIYDVHSEKRSHFLTMEFVEGQSLRDFVKVRNQVEPMEALRLIADVSSALEHAAKFGITHRDLKLSNVLVSSRGRPKLVDFGLASISGQASDEALAKFPNPRTVDYAALERASGTNKDDPRSDIFFVGGMLYHMLSGQAPHRETKDRLQRMSTARLKDVVPLSTLVPDLPSQVLAIVNKAMELDPDRRYQTPAELTRDLKLVLRRMKEAEERGENLTSTTARETDGAGDSVLSDENAAVEKTLMFVESDIELQNVLREQFKKLGFRVLMISEPTRAAVRFREDAKAADCVIFSTNQLGRSALEAYNSFGRQDETSTVPAVLLLGGKHGAWKADAETAPHRVVLSMPVRMKQFRAALHQLFEATAAANQ